MVLHTKSTKLRILLLNHVLVSSATDVTAVMLTRPLPDPQDQDQTAQYQDHDQDLPEKPLSKCFKV